MLNGFDKIYELINDGKISVIEPIMTLNKVPENIDTGKSRENKAKNRLFYWLFEEKDLREITEAYQSFREAMATSEMVEKHIGDLDKALDRITERIIRKGINPIEAMLYGSKVINSLLVRPQYSRKIMEMHAYKIASIYLSDKENTVKVLKHIIRHWSWIPQNKIVIMVTGLIREDESLYEEIRDKYSGNNTYKRELFYTYLKSSNKEDIEQILNMVANLDEDKPLDNEISRVILEEYSTYGKFGFDMLMDMKNNGMPSRFGMKVIRKIIQKSAYKSTVEEKQNDVNLLTTAKNSITDDSAYDEIKSAFMANEVLGEVLYQSRFSRREVSPLIIDKIKNGSLDDRELSNAYMSLGFLANKGSGEAKQFLLNRVSNGEYEKTVVLASQLLAGSENAANDIAELFSLCKETEFYSTQRLLNQVKGYRETELLQKSIELEFLKRSQVEDDGFKRMLFNLGNLYNHKNGRLISENIKEQCLKMIKERHSNVIGKLDSLLITVIDILKNYYSTEFEALMFELQHDSKSSNKVKQYAMDILGEQDITAPR